MARIFWGLVGLGAGWLLWGRGERAVSRAILRGVAINRFGGTLTGEPVVVTIGGEDFETITDDSGGYFLTVPPNQRAGVRFANRDIYDIEPFPTEDTILNFIQT